MSESFANDAARTAGTVHADGRMVTNAVAEGTSLTISYDAASGTYAVASPSGSQNFAPANIDSAESTSVMKVFSKTNGALTESLSLTGPGTAGTLTYQYVGAGFYERTTRATSTIDFSFDAFTYGVKTPDASLPRSGTAGYSVDLAGARAADTAYALAGYGTLQVGFGSGLIETSGTLQTVSLTTGQRVLSGTFFGSATLSSSSNGFAGWLKFEDSSVFSGSWAGRFYGPDAQEVGAAFSVTAPGGEIASGVLIGRQDAGVTLRNVSLAPLTQTEIFDAVSTAMGIANGTGTPDGLPLRFDAQLGYDAATGTFRYMDAGNSIDQSFAPSSAQTIIAGADMNRYRITAADGFTYDLALSRPAGSNPAVTLSYLSYGQWSRAATASAQGLDRWFAWGVRTNSFQLPRTGTASFSGIIRGTAATANGGPVFNLSGTSSFALDFAAATFTGSLSPVGTNVSTGAVTNFATYTVGSGVIASSGALDGNMMYGSVYLGYFQGALYGPQAAELGGVFAFNTQGARNDGTFNNDSVHMNGVVAATRSGQ